MHCVLEGVVKVSQYKVQHVFIEGDPLYRVHKNNGVSQPTRCSILSAEYRYLETTSCCHGTTRSFMALKLGWSSVDISVEKPNLPPPPPPPFRTEFFKKETSIIVDSPYETFQRIFVQFTDQHINSLHEHSPWKFEDQKNMKNNWTVQFFNVTYMLQNAMEKQPLIQKCTHSTHSMNL